MIAVDDTRLILMKATLTMLKNFESPICVRYMIIRDIFVDDGKMLREV